MYNSLVTFFFLSFSLRGEGEKFIIPSRGISWAFDTNAFPGKGGGGGGGTYDTIAVNSRQLQPSREIVKRLIFQQFGIQE